MAAIFAREKNGDNSVQVLWGSKYPKALKIRLLQKDSQKYTTPYITVRNS